MNLEEETRKGYTISKKMKSIWNIQMKMVKKVLAVCKKYNLKIWADGGTLLGTVREHGYIPWDDDVDLVMLREDYNKLLEIAPKEFKEPYFFQCAYTDKFYPRGHSQIRYNGTTAILPTEINCNFNQSIFIDIFVYDYLPKNKNIFVDRLLKAEHLRNLMNTRVYGSLNPKDPGWMIRTLLSRIYFFFVPFKKIFSQFEKLYSEYDCELDYKKLSCPTFYLSQVFNIRRERDWYSETILMPFEDIQMPVPIGYDEILKNQYGDYMTPVKAPNMHGTTIFDTDRSYKDVLQDLKSHKNK